VPGCPPRPEALLHGIIKLQERIGSESLKQRYARGELEPIVVEESGEPLRGTPVDRVKAGA
jgi:NADH-quinone oxidoreductase subunit B